MNIENELKLIPTKEIINKQIIDLLFQKGILVLKEGKLVHQEDTYFDDKDGTLEKQGKSFRIRRKDKKWVITYKTPIESDTEYKQRGEYEIPVSEEFMEKGIDVQTAMDLLKEQYPQLQFPENMGEVVTVINDRNKMNFICPDGTIIEMAFDTLQGKDENGELYSIRPEIEFEIKSGKQGNLTTIFNAINKKFKGQFERNELSKYARTKKEIEGKLTTEEVTICAMLSQILQSSQFDKLRYKGQILHKYDQPTIMQLDVFKEFEYLVDRVSKIKSGEYKVKIPRSIAETEEMIELLKSGEYEIKDQINLEDMFCLLLSDVNYKVADEVLVDFLDNNYYADDNPLTNRLSHSQQVMLGTLLICKSSQVKANLKEKLTSGESALSHDIGHVPFAHRMEDVLQKTIGLFSHDSNGADVIEEICESDYEVIFNNVLTYIRNNYIGVDDKNIEETIKEIKRITQTAIKEHSRTNSEKRGEGIVVQGPREADKILYVVSDIRDLQKFLKDKGMEPVEFFSEEFVKAAVQEICKDKTYEYDNVKEVLEREFIEPIRAGKYGRAVVNVINTIKFSKHDQKEYYDVKQDLWDFMDKTIKRTKEIRKEHGFDEDRDRMDSFSEYIITKKLVREYLKDSGDIVKSRADGLHDITNMGELDALVYANNGDLLGFSRDAIKRMKSGDYSQLTSNQIQAVREKTYELLAEMCVQTGHGTKNELDELKQEVEGYNINELIDAFFKSPVVTKIDKQLLNEFKIGDVQLKLIPNKKITREAVLAALKPKGALVGHEYCSFEDLYFQTNLPDKTLSLRRVCDLDGNKERKIRVKQKLPKKVSEIIRNVYEVTGESNDSVLDMLEALNKKYPGLNAEITESAPYRHASVKRDKYMFQDEDGQIVEVREDKGTIINRRTKEKETIHQIEIYSDAKTISRIKKKLIKKFGEGIFTQETKEEGKKIQTTSEESPKR